MSKIRILIADEIDIVGLKKLPHSKFQVDCRFGISSKDITLNYGDYDILVIRSIRKIDKKFLENTSFTVIATCTKGTDHIDTDFARKRGIKILNADDSNTISAAEHTLGLILAIEKKILFSDSLVRKGRFKFYDYERNELHGKRIGIIGFGKVGSHVGHLCKAFGMDVYANDTDSKVKLKYKNYKFKSLNFILKNCDIVSLHIPMNKRNYKFISKEKLKLLGCNSILVNTSRGDVIDEKALLNLLEKNKIKFAGLDVFSGEPFINRGFAALPNVVLTNHIAGKTIQSKQRISENIFRQINEIHN